jgi:hypothetical protein
LAAVSIGDLTSFPVQMQDIAGCRRTVERPLTAEAPLRIPVSASRDGDPAIRKRIVQLEEDDRMLGAIQRHPDRPSLSGASALRRP